MTPPRFAFILGILILIGTDQAAHAQVTLQVTPVEGAESRDVDFGTVRSLGPHGESDSETVVRRVRLIIDSQSTGRYQVFQRMNAPWGNLAGEEFPLEPVRFFVSESPARGDVRTPNPVSLAVGDREIYLSDASGSDTELVITYTVQVPQGQQAGRYQTSVSYRVVTQ